jgi:hypothetical protein
MKKREQREQSRRRYAHVADFEGGNAEGAN